jgi:hypothetical protein
MVVDVNQPDENSGREFFPALPATISLVVRVSPHWLPRIFVYRALTTVAIWFIISACGNMPVAQLVMPECLQFC